MNPHDRYYLYYTAPNSPTMYRTSTGSWSESYYDAMLWSNKRIPMEKLEFEEARNGNRMYRTYGIGGVTVC